VRSLLWLLAPCPPLLCSATLELRSVPSQRSGSGEVAVRCLTDCVRNVRNRPLAARVVGKPTMAHACIEEEKLSRLEEWRHTRCHVAACAAGRARAWPQFGRPVGFGEAHEWREDVVQALMTVATAAIRPPVARPNRVQSERQSPGPIGCNRGASRVAQSGAIRAPVARPNQVQSGRQSCGRQS